MDDIIKIVFTTLIPCVLTYLFSELKNYRKAQADIKRHGAESTAPQNGTGDPAGTTDGTGGNHHHNTTK